MLTITPLMWLYHYIYGNLYLHQYIIFDQANAIQEIQTK